MQRLKKYLNQDDFDRDIQKATDYPYIRVLERTLTILRVWPSKELKNSEPKFKYLILIASALLQLLYLVGGYIYTKTILITDDINVALALADTYIMIINSALALTRACMLPTQNVKQIVVTYLTKMHLFYYKDVSEYAMKTHKRIHVISHFFTLWLAGQMFICTVLVNLLPMYNNYASGKYKEINLYNTTYEHALNVKLPFDTTTQFKGYLFLFCLNWVDSYACGSLVCIFDIIIFLVVFHLWGHYLILLHDLDSFPLPAEKEGTAASVPKSEVAHVQMYSENELKVISKKLRECIDYHRIIVNFTNNVSSSFGPMLFFYLVYHQIIECILLLECSKMTTEILMRVGPITLILFQQLIQLSIIFELIGSSSEKLKDAVYGLPWEYMDLKNRKIVAIFLMNVLEPVHVKALGISKMGVTSMATIIKTSFSYFTFLRSLSD